jgi:Fe2+ transport system protein FeoA
LRPLDEARPGETVTVTSVFERDRKLLEYLDGVGIRPGVALEVAAGAPEVEIRTNGQRTRIERGIAGKVWVR